MAVTPPAQEEYHGEVRGGRVEVVEGRTRGRCVIREFPDYPLHARLLPLGGLPTRAAAAPTACNEGCVQWVKLPVTF
jgi:hypothetical protein